jgi:hypothetical protein
MKSRKALSVLVLFAFVLAGCPAPQRHAKVVAVRSPVAAAITYPVELRGVYFFDPNAKTKYCAEPAPDVALATLQKLTANLSATLSSKEKIEAGVVSELSSKVVQLAGRTELLLIAREMMYRACELCVNNPTDPNNALKLYDKVAELITTLADADEKLAEAELLKQRNALKAGGEAFDKPH